MLTDLEKYFDCKIELIFSKKRKTLSIQINPNGIKIRSSYWMPENEIKKFLFQNDKWIRKKLAEQKIKIKPNLKIINNQKIILSGEDYFLKINSHLIQKPELENNLLKICNHIDGIKSFGSLRNQVEYIIRNFSYDFLYTKTQYFSKIMSVEPLSIRVKNYKSRWGSCSAKGDISYNWKIIFAPSKIIDYLIIHELSHLVFFNHSKRFWLKVEEYQPDFKENRKWLKDNSYKLDI